MVNQLVRGLAVSPECESFFHGSGNLWESWRYYEVYLRGPRTHFVVPPWRVALSRHASPLERVVATTGSDRSWHMRGRRFVYSRYAHLVSRGLERINTGHIRGMDVYHSPFLPIPPVVKSQRKVRRFTTIYDLIALSEPQFFVPHVARMIQKVVDGLEEADHAVCISEATRLDLLERAPQLDPARVFVTPLAAGADFYPETNAGRLAAARRRLGLMPETPYFLSLSTLEPRKNLDSVIRAFARLKQEGRVNPETRLVLAGNLGWKTEKFFDALEEAGPFRDSIVLAGFVPDEELAALYSGALAFVYMSWVEGFGLPPLEAMQCGVPVICSNTSSLPEVVGDAGLMLAPADLDGITGAMETLAGNDELRRNLAARALDRAKLFSWGNFVRKTLDAYRTALAV